MYCLARNSICLVKKVIEVEALVFHLNFSSFKEATFVGFCFSRFARSYNCCSSNIPFFRSYYSGGCFLQFLSFLTSTIRVK